MTSKFSIDNRELLQRISSGEAVVGIDFGNLIVRELAAFRLVAMGSEPVAIIDQANLDYLRSGADADVWPPEREEMGDVLLYRHAQQPVVPEKATVGEMPFLGTSEGAYVRGWNDCRAAMLQENAKSAGVSNNCRSSENVQVMQDHQIRELVNQLRDIAVKYHAAGQLREQIARVIRAAMLQAGNSPVIPDGWTGNDKANAALMMLDRIETVDPVDDDRIDGIKCIVRELASATQPQNAPRNIPEIISGWIPVSERMPEDEQEVLTINKMGHRFVSFFDKHSGLFFDRLDAPAACCIEHVLVTHWMPLPAAPQEVKGE
ncbi:TPA: DUF551 domain-containing protein [Klebsiella pneumoniae]